METQSRRPGTGILALGALGVVFGDIGTSPLYTVHECLGGAHGLPPSPANVLGVLSLIFWSLTMVVSVKYVAFVMRADNHGEGGIFALLALLPSRAAPGNANPGEPALWASLLVIAGAALLYGDGMITPAISVLSAVEGLEVATPALRPLVLPLTCVILFGLFAIQSRGTGRVGRLFGPVMVLWFLTIGLLGARQILRHPAVLAALDPRHGLRLFAAHGRRGFVVLGSVVLAVTGGEALYADLGHFGRRPIRGAWFAAVMPALVLDYFGQGALLLAGGPPPASPFFAMLPAGPATYALVLLSTAATVIASQALISGAFSMTHQAVQLGFLPTLAIRHTSPDTEGQIYVPEVNWLLAVACTALVLLFRRSERLAAAYGIAVTGTMVITSIVFFLVTRATWRWPLWKALPLLLLFLSFDLPFFGANLLKLRDGGFVPLLIGAVAFAIMATWQRGRRVYREHLAAASRPIEHLFAAAGQAPAAAAPARCPGVGVFLTSHPQGFPPLVLNLAERMHFLPETVVLLTMNVLHVPHAPDSAMTAEKLGAGVFRVVAERGFMDPPNVPRVLERAASACALPVRPDQVTYYVGRDRFLASPAGRMGRVAEGLFSLLARNARSATDRFGIPAQQVVEIGSRIDL